MNRFLVSAAGILNVVLAILIIFGLAILGASGGGGIGGFIRGGLVGLAAAFLICGVMALIIDIRNSLQQLVELNRAR
jgi:hypothetical protein